jgi:hypothetical protein
MFVVKAMENSALEAFFSFCQLSVLLYSCSDRMRHLPGFCHRTDFSPTGSKLKQFIRFTG